MSSKTGLAISALLIGVAPITLASATWKRSSPQPDNARAHEVRKAFQTAWDGYYEKSFPHDTLLPISGRASDDRNAWGVTVVDALSTAIVMEEPGITNRILQHISTIDFTTTKEKDAAVSLFETNIRYLGGLIAGYDLLNGPSRKLVDTSNLQYIETLLTQATTLADGLSIAFDTPTGIPRDSVYLNPIPRTGGSDTNGPAGFGTLILEWTRLSDLSGNKTYSELAKKAQKFLLEPTGVPEAYPGLVGYTVDISDGKFTDNNGGWGGGIDSFYEYLIKMYLYDKEEFGEYKDRWVLAAESTMKYLASHPTSRKDLTFLADYDGRKINPWSSHLASFAGGNFILAGVILDEPKYTEFGITLAGSYYEAYKQTASKIGPEGFQWVTLNTNNTPPAQEAEFYERAGFWATSKSYLLRPETIESLYYAYRVTGDKKYQNMAWDAFKAIQDLCRTGYGFSGLEDVTQQNGGGRDDFQQSFFLAETLKYLYLVFANESEVQFQGRGKSQFVFNTEAHPFRLRG
ncbi:Mannosyl-oligosaccharide alpha-1,2-mannosidase 1B [Conoideocrella luteorostrata]|uniref:alpha-1,2-Mannosidase n=1 Tax=Conoideocrella luteorostrata TaxID=1105319 RepID=A0AAJ0FVI0_9HYPO|nr:Mannosyl-oligosaccharide alpha-1,2-mannosidase 1B [Conoideocrella luteorostrata]